MVALLEHAARGHGVGTAKDLADYFRLPITTVRPLLEEMADDGLLDRVQVEGWKHPATSCPTLTVPRRVDACALVSPFDSMMWERDRIERLFGFRYRIEIYVPRPKRVFGYYVLPFLLGDRYVARVDLKADRPGSRLLVQSAFAEPGVDDSDGRRQLLATSSAHGRVARPRRRRRGRPWRPRRPPAPRPRVTSCGGGHDEPRRPPVARVAPISSGTSR